MSGRFVVAAHVKHPSHLVEQPTNTMPTTSMYIEAVRLELALRGIPEADPDWGVFVACDRDAVIAEFEEAFGDHAFSFSDVRRSTITEDEHYIAVDPRGPDGLGYQVQHVVASSPELWSTAMATEVVRDAYVMSHADVLLHVVSNIATAISFLNPRIDMVFMGHFDENPRYIRVRDRPSQVA
jgi:hypothetical protein